MRRGGKAICKALHRLNAGPLLCADGQTDKYTLTETLRAGQLEGTQEQFAKVEEQYQCTMDAIRALD